MADAALAAPPATRPAVRFIPARAVHPGETPAPGDWHVVTNPDLLPAVYQQWRCTACTGVIQLGDWHLAHGENRWHDTCLTDEEIRTGQHRLPIPEGSPHGHA